MLIRIRPTSPAVVVHKLGLAVASAEDVGTTAADGYKLVSKVNHISPIVTVLGRREHALRRSGLPWPATLVVLFSAVETESNWVAILRARAEKAVCVRNAKQLVFNLDWAAVDFCYLPVAIESAEKVLLASEIDGARVLDVLINIFFFAFPTFELTDKIIIKRNSLCLGI